MAGDEGSKAHFPRVLPGKEEDDQEAEAAGGKGAVRAGEGIDAYRDPPSSRLVGRKVRAMVRVLGGLPRGDVDRRRTKGLHAWANPRGEVGADAPGGQRRPVHVPRPGLDGRRPDAGDEQQDRGRHRRPAEGRFEEPSGVKRAQTGESRLLVVLSARGEPEKHGRHVAGDADRRRCRKAEGRIRGQGRRGRRSAEMGRGACLGRIASHDKVPVRNGVNNCSGHTFVL